MLTNKKCLIFGIANTHSIAYGIAKSFQNNNAMMGFSYLNDAIHKRVLPIAEECNADFIFQYDATDAASIHSAVETVKQQWGTVDVLIHSMAYANKEDLQGRFIDTTREGFTLSLDVSAYSLIDMVKHFEPILNEHAAIVTISYYGAEKYVPNYNVMGVAKSALESSVRYLAVDLGKRNIRVNAVSAGPIRTLAASGITNFAHILRTIEEKSPLQRNVTIEEVGNAVLFLSSPLAGGITGEVLHVDCGYNIIGL